MQPRIQQGTENIMDDPTNAKPTPKKTPKSRKPAGASTTNSYVNVNRAKKGYKDKYKIETDKALRKFKADLGKPDEYELTDSEWRKFFTTIMIPLDKEREIKMIAMFKDDRKTLNDLLILHNTKAGDNLAEVYYKRYQKDCPTKWYDLDDFKQLASEGLTIAATKFDPNKNNRFLTYATWWILNKVRKPYYDKGAMGNYTSLNAPCSQADKENKTTLEEILGPDKMDQCWDALHRTDSNANPLDFLEHKGSEASHDLFAMLKTLKPNAIENIEKDKVGRMVAYLVSIVERNENSYNNKQIFLYLFKKIFNKYSNVCQGTPNGEQYAKKLSGYVTEAAKSKVELLKRLNMDENQYEMACRNLTMGRYDGV